jgi:hypothetical protein
MCSNDNIKCFKETLFDTGNKRISHPSTTLKIPELWPMLHNIQTISVIPEPRQNVADVLTYLHSVSEGSKVLLSYPA